MDLRRTGAINNQYTLCAFGDPKRPLLNEADIARGLLYAGLVVRAAVRATAVGGNCEITHAEVTQLKRRRTRSSRTCRRTYKHTNRLTREATDVQTDDEPTVCV